MKQQIIRYFTSILVGLALALPILGLSQVIHIPFAHAQEEYSEEYSQTSGLPEANASTLSGLIRVILGLIGMIFVITTFMGGVKLVVAGDHAEDKGSAMKMLTFGVIGLAVVFSAYIIVTYIVSALSGTTL